MMNKLKTYEVICDGEGCDATKILYVGLSLKAIDKKTPDGWTVNIKRSPHFPYSEILENYCPDCTQIGRRQ